MVCAKCQCAKESSAARPLLMFTSAGGDFRATAAELNTHNVKSSGHVVISVIATQSGNESVPAGAELARLAELAWGGNGHRRADPLKVNVNTVLTDKTTQRTSLWRCFTCPPTFWPSFHSILLCHLSYILVFVLPLFLRDTSCVTLSVKLASWSLHSYSRFDWVSQKTVVRPAAELPCHFYQSQAGFMEPGNTSELKLDWIKTLLSNNFSIIFALFFLF